MSRQAAIITGVIIIVLLLVCNLAVAVFAIPRVLAYFQPSRPAVAQPTPARTATPPAQPVLPTATPQRAPQGQAPQAQPTVRPPQGQPTVRPPQGQPTGQAPAPGPQITIVIPGGGQQALPTATPGASPTLGPSPTPFATVAPLALSAQEQALATIYNRAQPGVVKIDVIVGIPGQGTQGQGAPEATGSGSGFVWDKNGHIVTNNHVVANARTVRVTFWDDTVAPAQIVGTDADSDLAVIKVTVSAEKLVPLELGDSDQVRVGQTAIALGNPFNVGTSMSLGIISAVGRSIPGLTVFQIPDAIQTDAPINPGNSGGPLLDAAGRVIGVNAQIRSETRANSGVGFAIPVNIVKVVVPDIIQFGKHAWPWLGLRGVTVSQPLADANQLKTPTGAYIDSVERGGPADKAGIKGSTGQQATPEGNLPTGGDVIVGADNVTIKSFDDLLRYVSTKARVGQAVELTIMRGGQETKLKITLEARPRTTP